MAEKVRALFWEECRVGGSIAGVTLVTGVLTFLAFHYGMGGWSESWGPHQDPDAFLFVLLGPPVVAAILLIFNPDYSGILTGGFSRRVLQLPIPTYVAVGVTVVTRTFLVLLVAYFMVAVAVRIYDIELGSELILLVVMLYLGVQLFDWLRKPISGLSSLLLVVLVGWIIIINVYEWDSTRQPHEFLDNPIYGLLPVLGMIGVALAAAYALAIPAVHAERIGKSVGVPEIWTWHRGVSVGRKGRLRPFETPIAAQVWLNLRTTGWILPVMTLVFSLIALVVGSAFSQVTEYAAMSYWSFLPFLGVFVGAAAQGGRSGIRGFRRSAGTPGYTYLQPLSHTDFALAQMLSNACSVAMTFVLITTIHVGMGGSALVTSVFPEALADGLTNMREVVWVLVSRSILACLLAWILLAITSRLVFLIVAINSILFVGLMIFFDYFNLFSHESVAIVPVATILICVTAGAYVYARRSDLIPTRTLLLGLGGWALATWVIFGACRRSIEASAPNLLWVLIGFTICVAFSALVPLPYISVLFDVRRRRQGGTVKPDSAQYAMRASLLGTGPLRVVAGGTVVALLAGCVWLGWPAEAAYKQAWRDRGYPTTLEELDAWYPAVPDTENRALQYMELGMQHAKLEAGFIKGIIDLDNTRRPDDRRYFDDLPITGKAELKLGEPLTAEVSEATEAYWKAVTSELAPRLNEIAASGPGRSRYPIDLTLGFQVELEDLSRVRTLGRELSIDALYWAQNGRTDRAAESLVSIFSVAESLRDEPIVISQLVRIGVIGLAKRGLEDLMNRVSFEESELSLLQDAFATALPPIGDETAMHRAMIGESMFSLDVVNMMSYMAATGAYDLENGVLTAPLQQLVYPAAAERIVMSQIHIEAREMSQEPWKVFFEWSEDSDRYAQTAAFAPLTGILLPALHRAYESEWRARTELDLAVVALGIERYRLATGSIPEELSELVPEFLESVPMDHFSPEGRTVRYKLERDGNYVVYSVGHNMIDDGADRSIRNSSREGDTMFSIVAHGGA